MCFTNGKYAYDTCFFKFYDILVYLKLREGGRQKLGSMGLGYLLVLEYITVRDSMIVYHCTKSPTWGVANATK